MCTPILMIGLLLGTYPTVARTMPLRFIGEMISHISLLSPTR